MKEKKLKDMQERLNKLIDAGIPLNNTDLIALSQELDHVMNQYHKQIALKGRLKKKGS